MAMRAVQAEAQRKHGVFRSGDFLAPATTAMHPEKTTANVLLVNHSAAAQQVAREVAARKGYIAHTAGNAFEALFQLGASRIDAVVCEANLPGRNSQWLHERITQLHPGTLFVVSPSGSGAEWESALEQLRPVTPQVAALAYAPVATQPAVVPVAPMVSPVTSVTAAPTASPIVPETVASTVSAVPARDIDGSLEPAPLQELDLSDIATLEEVSFETVQAAEAQESSPAGLAELAAQEVAGDDRRTTPRYRPAVRLPVLLRGGREGLLRDLSVGGALIETDAHVGPERVFELKVGEADDMVRALVQVVRCDVAGVGANGITYRVGVKFKSPLRETDIKKLLNRGTP